jgi:hypothetical protein
MDGEDYITIYGDDTHGLIPIPDELWEAYEVIAGRMASNDPRNAGVEGIYFSCSC